MKHIVIFACSIASMVACTTTRHAGSATDVNFPVRDTLITQSLFNDKSATISEANIREILDGDYKLPKQLRVAVVRLDPAARINRYYWSEEQQLKAQQAYLDLFAEKFRQSARVTKLSIIPDFLVSETPSFTNIREAAVRMQADIVVVYAITSDLYAKYKIFSKADMKAYATTQLIILDVRTGLIPFSAISTKDYLSQKKGEELDHAETAARIQNDAVLLTIHDIGQKIGEFLNNP